MRSGFANITKAKERQERRQAQFDAQRVYDVRITEDGGTAELFFNGTSVEPIERKTHSINLGGNKFRNEICASEFPDHDGCVFCHEKNNGDKRIGPSSSNFFANVADGRWVHKEKDEAESKRSGRDRFTWTDCPDDNSCKLCRRKVDRTRRGQAKLRLSMSAASALGNRQDQLNKRCFNCGGKISCLGYRKGKEFLPDLEDIEDPTEWTPQYECSKCEEPLPKSVFNTSITMMRNGTGKSTTYSFDAGESGEFPEWVQALEPLDLDAVLQPRSAESMAELLGIPNPFGPQRSTRKATSYRKDEDEEEEETFAKKTEAKSKAAKWSSNDEEDEDN